MQDRINDANLTVEVAKKLYVLAYRRLRKRVYLRIPVREIRTPGSVRGWRSNPSSYRDYAICLTGF